MRGLAMKILKATKRRQRCSPSRAVVLALAFLSSPLLVHAQESSLFAGPALERPCALKKRLMDANCELVKTRRRRADSDGADTQPVPSLCTCTTPFFNIWSACSMFEVRPVPTLPTLKDWTSECEGSSVQEFKTNMADVLGGVKLPKWAMVGPPEDGGIFNAKALIIAASPPPGWSTLQIIAPIASALLAIILSSTMSILLLRHGPNSHTGPSFFERWRHTERVHSAEPSGDWTIDKLDSDPVVPAPTTGLGTASHHRTSARRTVGERLKDAMVFSNPFKSQPVRVKSTAPGSSFRLDDYDHALDDPHKSVGVWSSRARMSKDANAEEERMERVTLISNDERRDNGVFLISKDGRDFTLSSVTESNESGAQRAIAPERQGQGVIMEGGEVVGSPVSVRIHSPFSPSFNVSPRTDVRPSVSRVQYVEEPGHLQPSYTSPTYPPVPASPLAFQPPPSPLGSESMASESFYGNSIASSTSRRPLPKPRRSDPVNLFPPSVRGAGYQGTPTAYDGE